MCRRRGGPRQPRERAARARHRGGVAVTAGVRLATAAAVWASTLAHCAGDRSRSPTCGLAQLAGPSLIQQQLLSNMSSVLAAAPRGLPASLPARAVGQSEQGEVLVAYDNNQLVMGYQGPAFPAEPGGYGLLVVDDSTARAQGVLLYESRPPQGYPTLGTVTGLDRSIALYGVRVDWPSVSNPRCPLLGAAPGSVAR
jgi:hypothetical protein